MNTSFYSVGIDHFFDHLANVHSQFSKSLTTTYPPHNIVELSADKWLVELAVAGFSKNEIQLELDKDILTINGHPTIGTLVADGIERTYRHKGISDRPFERKIVLAEHVEVSEATLKDGMLKIYLERKIPDHKKPKKIHIV